MHVLGRDRVWIYTHPESEIVDSARECYSHMIRRRASGVPVQHLIGHQEFWGLDFEVTPDVLIPRPETEHVIEVALERLGIGPDANSPRRNEEFRIADVGTGSGCIAIALAHELPAARIAGITGSSGKTTTKDIAAQLIERLGPTIAPAGSFNNEFGHPLTVLRADAATRYLVLELSARGIGHIAYLCGIAPPR